MSSCAVIIATCGGWEWAELARERALPSAQEQQPDQLILHHGRDQTVCQARNCAAHAAEADWLIFLDADDQLDTGYLNALRPYLDQQNHDLLLAPYVRYVANGITGPPHIPNAGGWPDTNDAVTGTAISWHLFSKLGGWDQTYWPWSDWELWLRATKAGASRIHIPGAVYVAYEGDNGENRKLTRQQALALHRKVKELHQPVWEP